jgi:hypothetical protein
VKQCVRSKGGGRALRLRPKITYANTMATIAVFLALGGGALAATSFIGSDGKIRGCVGKQGALTVIKAGKKCAKGTTALVWNQTGPGGARGAACLSSDPNCKGPQGDPCASSDPNCRGAAGAPGSPAASMLTGRFEDALAGSDGYAPPIGKSGALGTESAVSMPSPAQTVVGRDLFVQTVSPIPGVAKVVTLSVNGTDSTLTCSVNNPATSCSDTSHAVVIPAGSSIALHYVYANGGSTTGGTPPDVRFAWRATTP